MYKRWQGNSGQVRHMEERPMPPPPPPPIQKPPPPPLPPLPFLGRFERALGGLETEDLLLMAILYLLYRESGDEELLFILAALLLL